MGILIKSITISTLGLFATASLFTGCNKETVELLKVKKQGYSMALNLKKMAGVRILLGLSTKINYRTIPLFQAKELPILTKEK